MIIIMYQMLISPIHPLLIPQEDKKASRMDQPMRLMLQ